MIGRVVLVGGILVLLFIPYLLWGTGLQTARSQSRLRQEFEATQRQLGNPTVCRRSSRTTDRPRFRWLPHWQIHRSARRSASSPSPRSGSRWSWSRGPAPPSWRRARATTRATPLPGQAGNVAIAGHRTTYLHPFYNLNLLVPGDSIVIDTVQGIFLYHVLTSVAVSPTDVAVAAPTPTPTLTLTTCNPRYSAAQRLVVHAALVGAPSSATHTAAAASRPPSSSATRRPSSPRSPTTTGQGHPLGTGRGHHHHRHLVGSAGRRAGRRAWWWSSGRWPGWWSSSTSSAPSPRSCRPATDPSASHRSGRAGSGISRIGQAGRRESVTCARPGPDSEWRGCVARPGAGIRRRPTSRLRRWTVRRRRMSSAPATRATPPMTASSSTSAPVKGRLDVPPRSAAGRRGHRSRPRIAPVFGRVCEPPATVGTTTGQLGVTGVIDGVTVAPGVVGQLGAAAPAMPGDQRHRSHCQPRHDDQASCPHHDRLPSTGDPVCPSISPSNRSV